MERQNPTHQVNYNGEEIELSYDNTTRHTFEAPYTELDYIHIRQAIGDKALSLFGISPLDEVLEHDGFPQLNKRVPSDDDLERFVAYNVHTMEAQIASNVGGELEELFEAIETYQEEELDEDDFWNDNED